MAASFENTKAQFFPELPQDTEAPWQEAFSRPFLLPYKELAQSGTCAWTGVQTFAGRSTLC